MWRPDKMQCEKVLSERDGSPIEAGLTVSKPSSDFLV